MHLHFHLQSYSNSLTKLRNQSHINSGKTSMGQFRILCCKKLVNRVLKWSESLIVFKLLSELLPFLPLAAISFPRRLTHKRNGKWVCKCEYNRDYGGVRAENFHFLAHSTSNNNLREIGKSEIKNSELLGRSVRSWMGFKIYIPVGERSESIEALIISRIIQFDVCGPAN